MNGASFSAAWVAALDAAHAIAGAQNWPAGALYVAATPIGNLADVSLRVLYALHMADAVACEDTRHTQALLRGYGLDRPAVQLLAVHQHNEAEAAHAIAQRLFQGQRIVYVSDAGTPGVSDPGARLCAALVAQGLRCIPLPGASSVTAAVSVAGCVPPSGGAGAQGFVFYGFLPSRPEQCRSAVQQLAHEPRCVVLLEAPHRIRDTALALALALGARPVTLAREMTKQFEQITTHPAHALPGWLEAAPQHGRGEFAIVIHPAVAGDGDAAAGAAQADEVLRTLLEHVPTKTAARLAADITGASRNALYQRALALRQAGEPGASRNDAA